MRSWFLAPVRSRWVAVAQFPVAVTLHCKVRETELPTGKVGIVMPVALKKLGTDADDVLEPKVKPVGQTAPPVNVVHVTVAGAAEQLSPTVLVSLMMAPSAFEGPMLANVSV